MRNKLIFAQQGNMSPSERKRLIEIIEDMPFEIIIEIIEDMPFEIIKEPEHASLPDILVKKSLNKKSDKQRIYALYPICERYKLIKKEGTQFLGSGIAYTFTKSGALVEYIENKSKNLKDISHTTDFNLGRNVEYKFLLRI